MVGPSPYARRIIQLILYLASVIGEGYRRAFVEFKRHYLTWRALCVWPSCWDPIYTRSEVLHPPAERLGMMDFQRLCRDMEAGAYTRPLFSST